MINNVTILMIGVRKMREDLNKKRRDVLEAIAPICAAFEIDDYDYIVSETGQRETLRIYNTRIGCSENSINAVIDELIGWLFVKRFCKNRSIGVFETQTLNQVRRYWLK